MHCCSSADSRDAGPTLPASRGRGPEAGRGKAPARLGSHSTPVNLPLLTGHMTDRSKEDLLSGAHAATALGKGYSGAAGPYSPFYRRL